MNKADDGKSRKRIKVQIIGALGMSLLLCTALASATYAWFTSNRQVSTGRVTAQAAQEDLQLLLSGSEDGPFTATEASIGQVNATSQDFLMPVSTANLSTFSVLVGSGDGPTARYALVEEERNYYHGRIYIKPTSNNMDTRGRMALYFDVSEEAGGAIVQDVGGTLTTAGRLGLQFQNDGAQKRILHLSSEENSSGDQVVVSYSAESGFAEVSDPSVPISAFQIQGVGAEAVLPEEPLAVLELNQVCPLDIYFYLEGCDPDCTDEISRQEIDLHMAFYGVLTQ